MSTAHDSTPGGAVEPDSTTGLVFADEDPATPDETRQALLASARRTMTPIRHILVQKPNSSKDRSSSLATFLRGRQTRALDALLILLALSPILDGTPLPSASWARLLSPNGGPLASPPGMSKTWTVLENMQLAQRGTRINRMADIRPLHEAADGRDYTRPGLDAKGTSKGYFWLPNDYWLDGWHEQLSLPGKAMLLIWLSATSQKPSFSMSYEQAPNWYGVSERSAERGLRELESFGLMKAAVTKVKEPRAAIGYTFRYHRYLTGPFSTDVRRIAHASMVKQARSRSRKTDAANAVEGGDSDD